MEPRYSMSVFAVVVAVALVLLSLAGFAEAAAWTAVGSFLVSAALGAESLRLLANGRRAGRESPQHRRDLDQIVAVQWVGSSSVGLLVALACDRFGLDPLATSHQLVDALLIGLCAGAVGVFLSSLVDWYVILPKVSGLSGPAPCEMAESGAWKYTTCVWYFHRALATAIVYLVVIGVPSYMSNVVSGQAIYAWAALATILAAIGGYVLRGMFVAVWFFLKPPVLVGDQIFVRVPQEGEGDVEMRRQRAYVLDVSIQGASYKILDGGRYRRGKFADKADGNVPNHKLADARAPRNSDPPLCAGGCTGVNWYCRCNPKAHD
jgi:hypothetical protein